MIWTPELHRISGLCIGFHVDDLIRRCPSAAEDRDDLCSELAVQVVAELNNYHPRKGPPEAVINTVVRSRLSSLVRRRMARKRVGTDEDRGEFERREACRQTTPDGGETTISELERERFIEQLPVPLREAAALLMAGNLIGETARQLGIPESTLRDQLREAYILFNGGEPPRLGCSRKTTGRRRSA